MFLFLITHFIEPIAEPYNFYWWLFYISPYSRIWEFLAGYILYLLYENYSDKVVERCFVRKILSTFVELLCIVSIFFVRIKGKIYLSICILMMIFTFTLKYGYISNLFGIRLFQELGKLSSNMFFGIRLLLSILHLELLLLIIMNPFR